MLGNHRHVILIALTLLISRVAADAIDDQDESEGTCLLQKHAAILARPSKSRLSSFGEIAAKTPNIAHAEEDFVQKLFRTFVNFVMKFDPFFRPVSSSVRACIMIIIMNLLIMTALVIVVNRNEAITEPHVYLLQLLQSLKRMSAIGPPFALFLIAARMHLNGSTDNLGSYPEWVTVCIYLVPSGILCQYLLVIMISLAIEWDDTPFNNKLGWPSMVHPWLHKLKYGSESSRSFFLVFQILVMLMIYASAIGVTCGMFQVATPTPSIMCTLLLTLLFSLVSVGNWIVHQGDVPENVIQFGHGMAIAVGMYQKTSMVVLLMLTDRQRAMFLDPPNGTPQPWAQTVFWELTATLYFDVLLSGFMARLGEKKRGNFGNSYYVTYGLLHVLKLLTALWMILSCIAIVASIFTLHQAHGLHVALSPTVMCVLTLCGMYFIAWEALEVVNVFKYCCSCSGGRADIAKFGLEACVNGLAISPLIGAICIAARMRALQISDGTASPQSWAQQAMYASVFSLILYTVCGVLIPVLQGGVENVDSTGNVNVDLKPLAGAHLIQTAKYFSLIGLYASVFAICISVFMITPKTADYGYHVQMSIGGIIKDIGIAVLVFVLALVLSSAKVIGLVVKYAVDGLTVRHCTLHMSKAVLSVARGYVSCSGVVVSNPKYKGGEDFSSPYLMSTDLMTIHIDTWRLLTSGFKEISIIKLQINGVHVHLEKSSYGSSSNIQIVLKGTPEEQAAAAAREGRCGMMTNWCRSSDSSDSAGSSEHATERGKPTLEQWATLSEKKTEDIDKKEKLAATEKSDRKIFLELVDIENVSATLVKTPSTLFDAEVGALKLKDIKEGDLPVEEIASMVISTILKTLWANGGVMKRLFETLVTDMCSAREAQT